MDVLINGIGDEKWKSRYNEFRLKAYEKYAKDEEKIEEHSEVNMG